MVVGSLIYTFFLYLCDGSMGVGFVVSRFWFGSVIEDVGFLWVCWSFVGFDLDVVFFFFYSFISHVGIFMPTVHFFCRVICQRYTSFATYAFSDSRLTV